MDKNLAEQIRSLQQNKAAIEQLMASPDGQRLLKMLQSDGGKRLQSATAAAAGGNTADVVRMIAEIMQTKDGSELLKRISNKIPNQNS